MSTESITERKLQPLVNLIHRLGWFDRARCQIQRLLNEENTDNVLRVSKLAQTLEKMTDHRGIAQTRAVSEIVDKVDLTPGEFEIVDSLLFYSDFHPFQARDTYTDSFAKMRSKVNTKLKEAEAGITIVTRGKDPNRQLYFGSYADNQRVWVGETEKLMRSSRIVDVFSEAIKEDAYSVDNIVLPDSETKEDERGLDSLISSIQNTLVRDFITQLIVEEGIFEKVRQWPVKVLELTKILCSASGVEYSESYKSLINNFIHERNINIGSVVEMGTLKQKEFTQKDVVKALIHWGCYWNYRINIPGYGDRTDGAGIYKRVRAAARNVVGIDHPFVNAFIVDNDYLQEMDDPNKAEILTKTGLNELKNLLDILKQFSPGVRISTDNFPHSGLSMLLYEAIIDIGTRFVNLRLEKYDDPEPVKENWSRLRNLNETSDYMSAEEFRWYVNICIYLMEKRKTVLNMLELRRDFFDSYNKKMGIYTIVSEKQGAV